jgi:hypothetical protein
MWQYYFNQITHASIPESNRVCVLARKNYICFVNNVQVKVRFHFVNLIENVFPKMCVADLSSADPSGRLVAGIAGSNPDKGMDVCLSCLYVVLSCVGASATG